MLVFVETWLKHCCVISRIENTKRTQQAINVQGHSHSFHSVDVIKISFNVLYIVLCSHEEKTDPNSYQHYWVTMTFCWFSVQLVCVCCNSSFSFYNFHWVAWNTKLLCEPMGLNREGPREVGVCVSERDGLSQRSWQHVKAHHPVLT